MCKVSCTQAYRLILTLYPVTSLDYLKDNGLLRQGTTLPAQAYSSNQMNSEPNAYVAKPGIRRSKLWSESTPLSKYLLGSKGV